MLLETLRTTIQQVDLIHLLIERYPKTFGLVERAEDILRIFRSGRIASLIGIQGLHQIGNSASVLRMYHLLGVRYATLCHNSNNVYADVEVSSDCSWLIIGRAMGPDARYSQVPHSHTEDYLKQGKA